MHHETVSAIELTIDQPGVFVLGNDISATPVAPDSLVLITTSSVVFDLGEFAINQLGTQASVDGIVISSGLTNITVRNGVASNVTGSGIRVGSSCSLIKIQGVTFFGCATSGAQFEGVATTGIIRECQLKKCVFERCSQSLLPQPIIDVRNSRGITIQDTVIADTSNTALNVPGNPLVGIQFTGGSNCLVRNVVIENLSGTTTVPQPFSMLIGIRADSASSGIEIVSCSLNSLSLASNGSFSQRLVGIQFAGSTLCLVRDTQIRSFTAATSTDGSLMLGIEMTEGLSNLINFCTVRGNRADTVTGIRVFEAGPGATVRGHELNNCLVGEHEKDIPTIAYSIESYHVRLLGCRAIDNSSGSSTGFNIQGNNNTIIDCLAVNNGEIGVRNTASPTQLANFYAKNISYGNGSVKTAQFFGISPLNNQVQNRSAVNSALYPWSNVGAF
jgi:hypothetical protein